MNRNVPPWGGFKMTEKDVRLTSPQEHMKMATIYRITLTVNKKNGSSATKAIKKDLHRV